MSAVGDDLSGPLSLVNDAMRSNSLVLVHCRNNHKLLGRIKAFDRHCNLIMEAVTDLWTESGGKGKRRINKDRVISKLFIRGDSVILIVRDPA